MRAAHSVLLAVLAAAPAWADPPKGAPKASGKIVRGIPDADRSRLLEQLKRAEAADTQQAVQALRSFLAAARASSPKKGELRSAAARKHPDYAAFETDRAAALKRMVEGSGFLKVAAVAQKPEKAEPSPRVPAGLSGPWRELWKKYDGLRKDVLAAAPTDRTALAKLLTATLSTEGAYHMEFPPDGGWWIVGEVKPMEPGTPAETKLLVEKPFTAEDESVQVTGSGLSDLSTSKEGYLGTFEQVGNLLMMPFKHTTYAATWTGWGKGTGVARSNLVEGFEVPSGYGKLRVTIKGTANSWMNVWSSGWWGGEAYASAHVRVRIEGPNGFGQSFFKPLGRMSADSGDSGEKAQGGPLEIIQDFTLPNAQGGKYLVLFGSRAHMESEESAGARVFSTTNIESLELEALP